MLTEQERWRLNQCRKLLLAAQPLIEEIVIRTGDPDSEDILRLSQKIDQTIAAFEDLESRFKPMIAWLPFAGEVV